VNNTEPREALREARRLVKSQQYAEALEKYVWFHEHALDADPALAGVRLSYAVAEWVDLGEVYPPARKALEAVRDAKTEALMQGTAHGSLFHDVASINRAFGQSERTRELFESIARSNRGAAEKCFRFALEALVDNKAFDLARSFLADPRSDIDQSAIPLKSASRHAPSVEPEMYLEAVVSIYVKRVRLVLQVLIGVGDESEANCLRDYAVERVPDPQLRDRVMERLYPSPPSRRIQ